MPVILETDEPSALQWKRQPPGTDANQPLPEVLMKMIDDVLYEVPRESYSYRIDHMGGWLIGVSPWLTKRVKRILGMVL